MVREVINDRRYYKLEENGEVRLFPSVTTIIGNMHSDPKLEELREKLGEKKWDQVTTAACNRGEVMHVLNEIYTELLDKIPDDAERRNETFKQAIHREEIQEVKDSEWNRGVVLFNQFYNSGQFKKIKKNIFNELYMYTTLLGGYAGTVDNSHFDQKDKRVIMDYKSSSQPKDADKIFGYLLQAAAYFLMYWDYVGKRPDYITIWMANESIPKIQEFTYTEEELKPYMTHFKNYCQQYWREIGDKDVDQWKLEQSYY